MPTELRARSLSGAELNSSFSLEATATGFDVVIESRSGTPLRNPDYEIFFELLLRRAADLGALLTGAWVESRETARLGLTPQERLLRAAEFPYPVRLSSVADLGRLRTTISGRQGAIGRKEGARGPGNRNKRIRLAFAVPQPLDEAAYVESIVLGENRGLRAELASVLPENDSSAFQPSEFARLEKILARYASATPEGRQRVTRAVERGPIGNLLKRAHGYRCQICRAFNRVEATFRKPDGSAYVEAHHVVAVAQGVRGSLRPENVIVVCAAHHRELHYGALAEIIDLGSQFMISVELGTTHLPKPDLMSLLAPHS